MNSVVSRAFSALGLFALSGQAQAFTPEGLWQTTRPGGVVEISACDTVSVCGTVISVDPERADSDNLDRRNPERALRDRPLIGLQVLWSFRPAADAWTDGRLYNPETGQTFSASMRLVSEDRLKVTGCLGPLCRSQIWTRVNPTTDTRDVP